MSAGSERVKKCRKSIKLALVAALGGSCNRCGYDKLPGLDFHHVNSADKAFTMSAALIAPKKIACLVAEASKCVLLCRCCHAEFHAGMWLLESIELRGFDPVCFEQVRNAGKHWCHCGRLKYNSATEFCWNCRRNGICPKCGTLVSQRGSCCKKCAHTRKCLRPSAEELQALLQSKSMTKIAEDYGVSNTSVSKWVKSYGLTKPSRGFWLRKNSKMGTVV